MLPIYQPYLPKECLRYAHDALDSTWISSQGVYIDKAKEKLKEIVGSKYVIMVNNGTCATHACTRTKIQIPAYSKNHCSK